MAVDLDKVIDRVRKLLRMAADTSSPNEAAIAAGRARKLMDDYQIGMDDLKESNGFTYMKVDKSYRFLPVWKNILAVAVAEFNDCKCAMSHEWKEVNDSYSKRLMFQGFESDVIVASAMYDYLTTTVDRLCAIYIKELGYDKYPAKLGDAYKKAAGSTLVSRLRDLQEGREANLVHTGTGTGLVVYKMQQVEAEFGKCRYAKVKVRSRRGDDVEHANRRGHQDAAKIGLDKQIAGAAQTGGLLGT